MTDNRTNVWGWLGLILVVALIGAGFLYQREGGQLFGPFIERDANGTAERTQESPTEPKQPAAIVDQVPGAQADASQPAAAKNEAGTIQAGQGDASALQSRVNSSAGNGSKRKVGALAVTVDAGGGVLGGLRAPGPWLYIDRKLVETQPFGAGESSLKQNLEMVPGSYNVEAVWTRSPRGSASSDEPPFVFAVVSSPVEVRAGEVAELALTFQHEPLGDNEISIQHPPTLVFVEPSSQMVQETRANADRQIQLFEADSLVQQLKELQNRWSDSANWPKKPVIMLNLSDEYGGPREVDAAQVRLLVDWLKWKYWKDFSSGYAFQVAIETAEGLEAKQQLDTIFALIKQYLAGIDELKSIASRLDEAKR